MHVALIKNLDGFTFYGDIPQLPEIADERFELYPLSFDDRDALMPFVFEINDYCGTALDFGDVDFFNKRQCQLLEAFIKNKLSDNLDEKPTRLFAVLKEYAAKAQTSGEGIVLEL